VPLSFQPNEEDTLTLSNTRSYYLHIITLRARLSGDNCHV